jgi:hypothetical protein
VKKISENRNNFNRHFQNDFLIYRIFSIEEIYQVLWEKSKFYKKCPILLRIIVPLFFAEKVKKCYFSQLRPIF